MNSKQKQISFLVFLIVLIFLLNYSVLNSFVKNYFDSEETGFVERVIDGDTLVINNESVRLLGINTPERGEKYYEEAKNFLEELVLNKTVELKFGKDRIDKYGRKLAYIFLGNVNINSKIVENGLANYYFPSGKDSYYQEFSEAWKKCLNLEKYLCEKSRENCIVLELFDYKSELVILKNICSRSIDLEGWQIKGEGRKKFIFPAFVLNSNKKIRINMGSGKNTGEELFWEEENVWTGSGDSIFLRNSEGLLVYWESY